MKSIIFSLCMILNIQTEIKLGDNNSSNSTQGGLIVVLSLIGITIGLTLINHFKDKSISKHAKPLISPEDDNIKAMAIIKRLLLPGNEFLTNEQFNNLSDYEKELLHKWYAELQFDLFGPPNEYTSNNYSLYYPTQEDYDADWKIHMEEQSKMDYLPNNKIE